MSTTSAKTLDQNEIVEFTPENKKRFDKILTQYDDRRSALLPVLHLAQEQWGYLPGRVVDYVAKLMELSSADVQEVISFYVMFYRKPVGKNHFQFCRTLSCWMAGGKELLESTCSRLGVRPGEVTQDGEFSIQTMECLGSCGSAPMVQVNETYYENLSPEKLNRLIASCKEGKPQIP